jgi:Protein of unknown function (DUF2934)
MGKSSKKSINRTSTRPARSARRNASAAPDANAAVTTAADVVTPTAEAAAPAAEAAAAQPEAPQGEVAQLAFHYFAESGYVHGNALDHWLRAESTLRRD